MASRRGQRRAFFEEIREEHRRRLDRLAERRGAETLKKLYDEAADQLEAKLRRLVGSSSDTFTAHQHRMVLAQVREGQARLMKVLSHGLADVTEEAQIESLRGLISDIRRLEKHFTGADVVLPIDEAGRFRGVINGRRESLLREHETSLANYGADIVTKIEDGLSLSMVQGETAAEAIDRVRAVTGSEWWRGERIVRTETMWASNITQVDGMKEAVAELPDMHMRWEEYVDDNTYLPRDDRVAEDSIAMHGQVVRVGERFRFPMSMPDGGPIPDECVRYIGETWLTPPMRPNDRARVSPWRPGWGIPGWKLVGSERVEL